MFFLWLALGVGLTSGSEIERLNPEETSPSHQAKVSESSNDSASTEESEEPSTPPNSPLLQPKKPKLGLKDPGPEKKMPILFLPPAFKEEGENPKDKEDSEEGFLVQDSPKIPPHKPSKFSILEYMKRKTKLPQL